MIETHTAIQGVCAWPNLQRLADGTLIASIFNQPCHGYWEGDIECWASEDDGRTWRLRSTATRHEPGTNRMNCAAGFAQNGDMIVLCSGHTNRGPVGQIKKGGIKRQPPVCICRSCDGARTWEVDTESFPEPPPTEMYKGKLFVPFGNIVTANDGLLCAAAYVADNQTRDRSGYFLRSRDDGRTWGEAVPLNPEASETCLLHLGGGRWLASCRNNHRDRNAVIELFSSHDDGRTWKFESTLTLAGQVTSHLMRLADGRVLLSYGNRNWGNLGVDVRFSDDEGNSWGPPIRIADTLDHDSGYPSCVQLPDGSVVTAYYTKLSHDFHYEMRVATWNPSDFDTTKGMPVQSG